MIRTFEQLSRLSEFPPSVALRFTLPTFGTVVTMDLNLLKTLLSCIIIQGTAAGVNVYVSLDDGGAEPSQEAFKTLGEYMNRTQGEAAAEKGRANTYCRDSAL